MALSPKDTATFLAWLKACSEAASELQAQGIQPTHAALAERMAPKVGQPAGLVLATLTSMDMLGTQMARDARNATAPPVPAASPPIPTSPSVPRRGKRRR